MEDGRLKTEGRGQRTTLLHAEHFGIADEVFLEVGVDGALAAQPSKGFFGLLTQRHFRIGRHGAAVARRAGDGRLHGDLDERGARIGGDSGAGIEAARGDQFGLGRHVGREDVEYRREMVIGEVVGFATENAADVRATQTGFANEVGLDEAVFFGQSDERVAEITHDGIFLTSLSHIKGFHWSYNVELSMA